MATESNSLDTWEKEAQNMYATKFSPNGSRFVYILDCSRVIIRDTRDNSLIHVLNGHTDYIEGAQFSHDSSLLATFSDDKTAVIWDVQNGKKLHTLNHTYWVRNVIFSHDDTKVATICRGMKSEDWNPKNGKKVEIWGVENGKKLHEFKGHIRDIYSMAFSDDDSLLITTSKDQTAIIWDIRSGQKLKTLTDNEYGVTFAIFNHDASKVLTASWDNTAIIWDVEDATKLYVLRGHSGRVTSAKFNHDGSRAVTVSDDGMAIIWDIENGTRLHTLISHAKDTSYPIALGGGKNRKCSKEIHSTLFSFDGSCVITTSYTSTVVIWDTQTGREVITLGGDFYILDSPSSNGGGMYVLTGYKTGEVKGWDVPGNGNVSKE